MNWGFNRRAAVRWLLVTFGAVCAAIFLAGCHSSGTAVTVQILPATSVSLDEGQSINFTATVANDTLNKGVTWSVTQASTSGSCSGSGCGALSNVTNSSATYTAPTSLAAGISVTLTVASVTQPSATTTATVSVVLPPQFTTTVLPNAANGVAYNQTITVTGGVAPLTFSLQSGSSLPAGLSLTTSGTIVGKPSVPTLGQPALPATFTVLVSDNSSHNGTLPTTPVSVAETYTISVAPPAALSIGTTSLPGAISNTKYTPPAIAAIGGVPPLTWSVVSGTLPAGLALSPTSGQITGIIPAGTASGNYSFTVQAQDQTLPSPGQTARQALSINVQAPQPLAVTTTVLPSGTTATAYSIPLQASGGIPPYTWTITSGLPPSSLTLGSNGILSGVPVLATTSPDQFTVQVQDSEVVPPAPVSQALALSINAGSSNGNSLITGAYSFLFNGFDSAGTVMIAGTITADGNGNITSGIEDSNRFSSGTVSAIVTGIALTGSYSLGPDGRGTMQLVATNPNTKVTLTTDYRLVVDSTNAIHFIQNNDITTPGVGTDTLGTHGEGILKPVLGTSGPGNFVGNYSFLFSGQDTSGKPAALGGVLHADGISTLIPAAGGVASDLNDAGTVTSQNITGSFSLAANNRGTATLLFEIPGKSQTTLTFAFYFVSPTDFFFVELDQTLALQAPIFYRLSGEMIGQPSAVAFSNASLAGSSVATGSALNGSNASVMAGLLTSTGGGNAGFTYDENSGGTVDSPAFPSGTYVVATNGRVTFSGLGSSAAQTRLATAYLTGPGQGFLLGSDTNVTTGLLEQQTGITTFSTSSIQGGYTLSAAAPAETAVPNLLGQVSSDGSGSLTGIIDEITPPASGTPEGQANLDESLIAHINFVGSDGRSTVTTNSPVGFPATMVLYVVSPAHFRAISADSNPGNAHPEVFFFDH